MHEQLWAGVALKIEYAEFFLHQMQRSLDRPRDRMTAALEASGAIVDTQWQSSFYPNLDAFLTMARSVPEIINCCFGEDMGNKVMKIWFDSLGSAEQQRRRAFSIQFETTYGTFRKLALSETRNITLHRSGVSPVEVTISGLFGLIHVGTPVKRVPVAESRPIDPRENPADPAVMWAGTQSSIPVQPKWSDFKIAGQPLFPECQAYLNEAQTLVTNAHAITATVHGANALTAPP